MSAKYVIISVVFFILCSITNGQFETGGVIAVEGAIELFELTEAGASVGEAASAEAAGASTGATGGETASAGATGRGFVSRVRATGEGIVSKVRAS